jgi:transposase-like protein
MGWMKTCPVHQRMRFVVLVENQEHTFAELCRHFGVSRKTGYKWLARYRAEGQPREHDDAVIALLSVQRYVLIAHLSSNDTTAHRPFRSICSWRREGNRWQAMPRQQRAPIAHFRRKT